MRRRAAVSALDGMAVAGKSLDFLDLRSFEHAQAPSSRSGHRSSERRILPNPLSLQARRAKGNLAVSTLREAHNTFWTCWL
jgi:hypothetical protein